MSAKPGVLRELTVLFLKLGITAFGGPAAHIAMMENEVVVRRRWLTREEFLDMLGIANLIPGPSSTEMAIFIGHRLAGWRGLLLSGLCFILPAALIVTGFAWGYMKYGRLPQIEGLLYGIKPVIIAIVLQALWNLGRAATKTKLLAMLAIGAAVLSFIGISPIIIIFGTGAMMIAIYAATQRKGIKTIVSPLLVSAAQPGTLPVSAATPFSVLKLFLFFLKVGSILFGSGYVLLAFLQADLVEHWHWLTQSQLLDAVAVGQFTPGPVFTTATFMGYILGGPVGAVAATTGIFLPSFILVALSVKFAPRI